MMNYTVAIGVLLSLNDSDKQFNDDTVLDAVEKILSMETINATPKTALLNALRWFWNKTVEEVEPEEATQKDGGQDEAPAGPYDLLYEEGGYNSNGV